ncbi:MAG: hypothetical protein AAF411_30410, partial [Myxococcota bacterium]
MRLFLAALVLSACGSPPPPERPVEAEPLPAELESSYENGVDFVDDPEILEGRWREQWADDLDRRVRTADLIYEVSVPTLRTDIDPEGRTTYRLIVEEAQKILGTLPESLLLTVREDQGGYASVSSNQTRIQRTPMVLFMKWALEDGQVRPRWHLAPASDGVMARVVYLAER